MTQMKKTLKNMTVRNAGYRPLASFIRSGLRLQSSLPKSFISCRQRRQTYKAWGEAKERSETPGVKPAEVMSLKATNYAFTGALLLSFRERYNRPIPPRVP